MLKKSFSKKVMCLVVIGSILSPAAVWAQDITKDETVYTTLSTDGTVKSQTVVDWIHGDSALNQVNDKSTLSNIKNLKGNDTPSKSGDSLIWNTDKNDIYYQGDTNKNLPFSFKITYFLNDKEISANDIAGQSGKVKIRISITNNEKHMVNINGQARTICAPIPVGTVIMLPADNFSSIKTNGGTIAKVANFNVVGFASIPGLMDSLGLKNGDYGINLPDPLEVTFDATDFKLTPIYFAASPTMLDLSKISGNDIDGLKKKIMDAKSGIQQLNDGMTQLDNGLGTLKSGIATMNDKVNTTARDSEGKPTGLKLGMAALTEGVNQLNNGLKTQLQPGFKQLFDGVEALNYNLNTKDTKDGKPAGLVVATDQLYSNIQQVNGAVNGSTKSDGTHENGFRDYISQIATGVKSEEGYVKGDPANSNPTGLRGGLLTVQEAVNQLVTNPAISALISLGGKTADVEKLQAGIAKLVANTGLTVSASETEPSKAVTLADAVTIYNNNMALFGDTAKNGMPDAKKFDDSVHLLGDKIQNELLPGMKQLNDGIGTLSSQVDGTLAPGMNTLNGGVAQLADGINSQLLPGITQLKDGSAQIAAGVSGMYKQVTPAISSVNDVMAAKDEIVKVMTDLDTFSGKGDGMKGTVKYVVQTSDIKVGNADAKKAIKKEKKSFWKKVYEGFLK